jgi:hypothetical protein
MLSHAQLGTTETLCILTGYKSRAGLHVVAVNSLTYVHMVVHERWNDHTHDSDISYTDYMSHAVG